MAPQNSTPKRVAVKAKEEISFNRRVEPTTNLTAQFLGDPAGWDAIDVQLYSVHGLWGGQIIHVTKSGRVVVRRVVPGARHEWRYEFVLTHMDAAALLGVLIEHDLLAIDLPHRFTFIPDEASTVLTVRKGRRMFTLTIWEADPVDARVTAIISAFHHLQRRTEGLTPLYDGPYQSGKDCICNE